MRKIYLLTSVFVAIAFTASTASAATIYLWDPNDGSPSGPSNLDMTVSPCPSAEFVLDVYMDFQATDDTSGKGPYAATFFVNYGTGVTPISSQIYDIGSSAPPDNNFDSYGMPGWSVSEGSATKIDVPNSRIFFGALDYWEWHQLGNINQYGQYKIGSAIFHCDECGITELTTSDWDPGLGGEFLDWGFQLFDDKVTFYGATVNQVPIPSTLLLLGTGLMGLMGLRRRK